VDHPDVPATGKGPVAPNVVPASDASPPLSADGLDVGLQALNQTFERMKIDVEWSVRAERRFVWWMKDFAQHIVVSKPTLFQGMWITRLLAKTPIAMEVPVNDTVYERLSLLNAYGSTLSALVLEGDGSLQLVNPGSKVLLCDSCNQVVIVSSDRRCPRCGTEVRLPS